MTWWGWILWTLLLLIVLLRGNIRLMAARTASAQRVLTQRKPQQESLSAAKTDRMIRENDHQLWPNKDHKHVNCVLCGPGPLLQGMVPSVYEHPFFKDGKEDVFDGYSTWSKDCLLPALAEYAETVSSKVIKDDKYTGMHTVMLDLDLPVTLVESSTPGHYHLYIDHPISWSQYKRLLRALEACGLIETDYYKSSISRGATHLRPPWVKKQVRAGKRAGKKDIWAVWIRDAARSNALNRRKR